MKKIFLILTIFLLFTPKVFAAATSSADTNPLPSDDLTKQIEQKVASTVAKLNLVEKRGFVGIVTDSNDTQITVNDLSGNTRFIDVDEFTQFSSPDNSSSFGISDIKNGDAIGVLGLYNKQSLRTLARFVDVMDLPQYVSGVVAQIDSNNFILNISTSNGNSKVSIESVTKTYGIDDSGTMTKSGFSQISVGENIVVSGFFDPKDKSVVTASRVFLFPGVPQNPGIELVIPSSAQPSSTIIPSTGSGLILTPITK